MLRWKVDPIIMTLMQVRHYCINDFRSPNLTLSPTLSSTCSSSR